MALRAAEAAARRGPGPHPRAARHCRLPRLGARCVRGLGRGRRGGAALRGRELRPGAVCLRRSVRATSQARRPGARAGLPARRADRTCELDPGGPDRRAVPDHGRVHAAPARLRLVAAKVGERGTRTRPVREHVGQVRVRSRQDNPMALSSAESHVRFMETPTTARLLQGAQRLSAEKRSGPMPRANPRDGELAQRGQPRHFRCRPSTLSPWSSKHTMPLRRASCSAPARPSEVERRGMPVPLGGRAPAGAPRSTAARREPDGRDRSADRGPLGRARAGQRGEDGARVRLEAAQAASERHARNASAGILARDRPTGARPGPL